MWTLVARAVAAVLAALVSGWRRDRALRDSGALQARLDGLRDVIERSRRAAAADRKSRADADLLRDDGYRRD